MGLIPHLLYISLAGLVRLHFLLNNNRERWNYLFWLGTAYLGWNYLASNCLNQLFKQFSALLFLTWWVTQNACFTRTSVKGLYFCAKNMQKAVHFDKVVKFVEASSISTDKQ